VALQPTANVIAAAAAQSCNALGVAAAAAALLDRRAVSSAR